MLIDSRTHRSLQWWNTNNLLKGQPFLYHVPHIILTKGRITVRLGCSHNLTVKGLWNTKHQGHYHTGSSSGSFNCWWRILPQLEIAVTNKEASLLPGTTTTTIQWTWTETQISIRNPDTNAVYVNVPQIESSPGFTYLELPRIDRLPLDTSLTFTFSSDSSDPPAPPPFRMRLCFFYLWLKKTYLFLHSYPFGLKFHYFSWSFRLVLWQSFSCSWTDTISQNAVLYN